MLRGSGRKQELSNGMWPDSALEAFLGECESSQSSRDDWRQHHF